MEALWARHLTSRTRTRRPAGPPSTLRPRRSVRSQWPPASSSAPTLATRSR